MQALMFFIFAYFFCFANNLYVGGIAMRIEDKITLRHSIAFFTAFALIFGFFCSVGFGIIGSLPRSESVSADAVKKPIIVIDPGHGGEDGGAIGANGILEKELNLAVSSSLAEMFRFSGFEVIETRTEDVMLYGKLPDSAGSKKQRDLAARLEIASSIMPDLFLGIHMNSFPDERYSGLTVYYSGAVTESREFAEALRHDTVTLLQPDNRREIKAGERIYLLERATYPSILVECGFISNPQECGLLSSKEYRNQLCFVIYTSLSSKLTEK
jgi:N-acetylmuramoyl-L-alanine amidase